MVELKTGGFGVAGLVGFTSLALFFGSSYLVGLAGWEEVLLLAGGLIALAVEVFLLPGFGSRACSASVCSAPRSCSP